MLPSGDQIAIACGGHRATVTSVGATLREYSFEERPLLDGFAAGEECSDGRGEVLMPWPNRVAGATYEFSRARHELAVDEPELGHAIHGLARGEVWRVERRTAEAVQLRHALHARPGYPFDVDLAVEYRLSRSGLAVTFAATNASPAPCPFGAGAHPYFAFPAAPVDALALCVTAEDWLEVDERMVPIRRRSVEGSAVDFRRPRPIHAAQLDHAFARLARDSAGVAWTSLGHGTDEILLWQDGAFDFVHVYTGDTLPDRARRRHSVALEPMTCAPDAFNSGDGLRVLSPGESFEGRWGVAVGQRRGTRGAELA